MTLEAKAKWNKGGSDIQRVDETKEMKRKINPEDKKQEKVTWGDEKRKNDEGNGKVEWYGSKMKG